MQYALQSKNLLLTFAQTLTTMATTHFYLDLRTKASDGKGSVVIALSHNRTTTTIRTGVRLAPEEFKDQKVVGRKDAKLLNTKLQKQKAEFDEKIAMLSLTDEFESMTAPDIKLALVKAPVVVKRIPTVEEVFAEYLEGGILKEGTKGIYNITLQKILSYDGRRLRIKDIDLKWLRGFDKFLSRTQGANGKAIYLRALRAVCNYARHQKYTDIYPFDSFQIKYEETQKRNIPVELLREFYVCPTSKINERYRDYFFLMFFLIGINVKDLLLAKKSQVIDNRLEYIREKTGKKYSIKLEPEAQVLLKRHEGHGKYLLDAMDTCVHHQSFMKEINKHIKTIGIVENTKADDEWPASLFDDVTPVIKSEPLIPDITTYYARHTWATFAHEIGISTDIISLALGHSFGNRVTLIYIKPDQTKVDDANRRVLDYFFSAI